MSMNGLRVMRSDTIELAVIELGREDNWYGPVLLSTREGLVKSKERYPT
jgi:hypothetical protein